MVAEKTVKNLRATFLLHPIDGQNMY